MVHTPPQKKIDKYIFTLSKALHCLCSSCINTITDYFHTDSRLLIHMLMHFKQSYLISISLCLKYRQHTHLLSSEPWVICSGSPRQPRSTYLSYQWKRSTWLALPMVEFQFSCHKCTDDSVESIPFGWNWWHHAFRRTAIIICCVLFACWDSESTAD